jgi:hypothetical protein
MLNAIKFTGDGRYRSTAILFTNAASEAEHIEMQYRFMEERGISFGGHDTLVPEDDEYIYNIQETSWGKMWFKIPKGLYGEDVRKKMKWEI